MIRSFIALRLPGAAVRALVALQGGLPVARAVPGENMHVTLAFLDDQPEALLRALCAELDSIRMAPFEVRLSGLAFYGGRNPSAIGVEADGGEALVKLHGKIARVVRDAGIDLDRRRFRPHVTIFRLRRQAEPGDPARLQAWLGAAARFEPIAFRAGGFALYRSVRTKDGPVYDALAEFDLAEGGEPRNLSE